MLAERQLLDDLMAAWPHRTPTCNALDAFIEKMQGFKVRYQQILERIPPDKVQELKEVVETPVESTDA